MRSASSHSRWRWIGLAYLLALGFFMWGFAVARYEVFPYNVVRPMYVQVRAFVLGAEGENKTLFQKLAMHRQVRPREDRFAYSDASGFLRVDSSFVDPGYLLVSRFSPDDDQVIIELVRLRDFETLHRWVPPVEEILERGPRDRGDNSRDGYRAQHPLLLQGGSVVFTSGEGPLVRIDRDSRIEWMIQRTFHHTIEQDARGNMLVPIIVDESGGALPVPYRDDGYAVVAPDGRILEEHSVVDLLLSSGHRALLLGIGLFEEDRIHLNDAQPVDQAAGVARPGDVVLSARNVSTVFLYRPSTGQVVWLATGPWLNQHDVNLLPDGRYSVFGNDMVRVQRRFEATDGISDIYIYDPRDGSVSRPYTDMMHELNAVTETAGRSRILDNGDAFVEIHDAAQLVRVAPDTVRWVFVNGLSGETVGLVHWARYYHEDELDLSWLPARGSESSASPEKPG